MSVAEKSGSSYRCCDRCQSIWIGEAEFLSLMEEVRPGKGRQKDAEQRRREQMSRQNPQWLSKLREFLR